MNYLTRVVTSHPNKQQHKHSSTAQYSITHSCAQRNLPIKKKTIDNHTTPPRKNTPCRAISVVHLSRNALFYRRPAAASPAPAAPEMHRARPERGLPCNYTSSAHQPRHKTKRRTLDSTVSRSSSVHWSVGGFCRNITTLAKSLLSSVPSARDTTHTHTRGRQRTHHPMRATHESEQTDRHAL